MAWMRTESACAALNVSPRTLRRRLKAGNLESKRQGRCLLVNVPDDQAVATVAEAGRRMATVAAGAALQQRDSSRSLAAVVATFDTALDRAERRALSAVRWGVGTSAAVVLCSLVAVLGIGWRFHVEAVDHVSRVADLQRRHTAQLQHVQVESSRLRAERDSFAWLAGLPVVTDK